MELSRIKEVAIIDHETFARWLADYGAAWEGRDPEAARRLFTPDALYYWTPFEEPTEPCRCF